MNVAIPLTAPSREDIMYQGPGGCIVGKYNVTKKRLSTERGFSMIVWKAADNCDVTMVATLRLRDMTIQHVGHQGARLAASRGVYFRSPGKLFRRAMARESDRAPQNLRSVYWHQMSSAGLVICRSCHPQVIRRLCHPQVMSSHV